MNLWLDGTIEGSQLIDKSGNNRHASITDSLVTNQDAILGSSFINNGGLAVAPTLNTSLNSSPPSGFSGYYSRVGWTVSSGFGLVRTEYFVSISGETQRYRFYYRRNTATSITWGLRPGNGSGTIATGTLSAAVGVWTQVTGTAVVSSSGGLAHLFLNVGAGTHEVDIFFPEGDGVTIDGQTGIGFALPVDATLSATDTKKTFYSATTGYPLTTRAAYQYNATIQKIRCGGAFKYIFLKSGLTTTQIKISNKILKDNFIDRDFAARSCPIVLPVSTTIQAAIVSARSGDFRDRTRITYNTDQIVDSYSDFTHVSGGGYMAYIATIKPGLCIEALSGAVIRVSKALSSTDNQLILTHVVDVIFGTIFKNVIIEKEDAGGYLMHMDATSMQNQHSLMLGCDLEENGNDGIYAYRAANALPQPAGQLAYNTIAGGMHPNYFLEVENTRLSGMRAFTWQDVACTSGTGGICYYDDCVLEAKIIYDVVSNPFSEQKEVVLLTSSGGGRDTNIFLTDTTRNSTIVEVGAVKSIFLTEI